MTDQTGQRFGNYITETLLATAPGGPAYLARHAQLRHPVVIRLFDAARETRERLLDLLRRVAALRHPHLVAIFDVGEIEERVFVAAEAPGGGTLDGLLQRMREAHARVSLMGALALVQQAAAALAFLHRQGMVHGALRPAVLYLDAPHEKAGLKVGDTGIATVLPVEATASPAYLAPEQARGALPDARSDVYALGVLLYELLVGAPPFDATTLDRAVERRPDSSPVPPRLVRPQLPPALESIILRCLAKTPAERFGDAGALLEALRPIQASLAVRPSLLAPPLPAATPLLASLLDAPPTAAVAPSLTVTPERERVELTPGRPTAVSVQVHHCSARTDRFRLTIEGVPTTWVRDADPPLELGPDGQAVMRVVITAPNDAQTRPGDYPVVVRVCSVCDAECSATARMLFTVLPRVASSVSITPDRVEGSAEGEYVVTLRNEGNSTATFELSADDRRLLLTYEFGQEQVRLAPGQSARVPLTVVAPRKLLGRVEPLRFSVFAEAEGAVPAQAQAEFVRRPLLPSWAPLAVALIVLVVGSAGLILSRERRSATPPPLPTAVPSPAHDAPTIVHFTVDPPVVAPGEPVTATWDVRGAERVFIEPFGDVPPLGERSFRPATSTDLRLIARFGDQETISTRRVLVEVSTPAAPPASAPPPAATPTVTPSAGTPLHPQPTGAPTRPDANGPR